MLGGVAVVTPNTAEKMTLSPTAAAVLLVLVGAHRQGATVAQFIDDIYQNSAPDSASAAIRNHLSRLRRAVGDALIRSNGKYYLDLPDDHVDVWDLWTTAEPVDLNRDDCHHLLTSPWPQGIRAISPDVEIDAATRVWRARLALIERATASHCSIARQTAFEIMRHAPWDDQLCLSLYRHLDITNRRAVAKHLLDSFEGETGLTLSTRERHNTPSQPRHLSNASLDVAWASLVNKAITSGFDIEQLARISGVDARVIAQILGSKSGYGASPVRSVLALRSSLGLEGEIADVAEIVAAFVRDALGESVDEGDISKLKASNLRSFLRRSQADKTHKPRR